MGLRADTNEVKGATVLLTSTESMFMTANNVIIDGGHTSW